MPSWTKEQLDAINKEGMNIIVSAGAGSGKTAVLTERVITKLKKGINVNELLVLTFTNEASNEMKQRIRNAIEKEENLKEQLNYLDSAYITTFDSYALSIVKKYHYLLNIPKNIINIDQSILNIKQKEYLNEIFEELYKDNNKFHNLINNFCFKDDDNIKELILDLSNKLDLKINKKEYINNYIKEFYNDNYLDSLINEYEKLLLEKIKEIKYLLEDLLIEAEGKYYEKVSLELEKLLNSTNYEEIKNNLNISLPRMYPNAETKVKDIKENISNIIKELKTSCIYQTKEEIKETINSTKENIEIILEIINKLDLKINQYKKEKNAYSFNDIAKMSIEIIKNNEEIKEETKKSFKEIMIDEYQDTSDLQEEFISLIENNNVYMVGDIKQSIYRFRNANPNIFKEKYNNYSKKINGEKIDLLKNFRSREEVLNNINCIFNLIMDEEIGGADYISTHQMVFGNNTYINEGKTNQNNNIEILNYEYETKEYSKEEIEIFIIANDIKNKIKENYQVLDKKTNTLRNITYNDFCIIMDRGSEFEKYKKIFEYLEIPTSIYQDEKLTNEYDILILKNILGLILKINKKEYDIDFRYKFISIARSYLFNINDNEIFNMFKTKDFYHNEIYNISKNISNDLNNLNNKEIILRIINDYNFYEKTIKVGSINSSIIRLDNIITISESLQDLGFTKEEMYIYLEEMINSNQDIKYQVKDTSSNSVKIMNIHKSKGLEFPICYFSGLHKEFNKQDINKNILFDNKYGIIIPYYKDGLNNIITKELLIKKYQEEEISEKIRLFYVALTRVKEKIILVTSLKDNDNKLLTNIVNKNIRLKYKSLLDIINSIKPNLEKYIKNININELNISKSYNDIKDINYKKYIKETKEKINYINIESNKEQEEEQRYSKNIHKLITKEDYNNMEYGKSIHKILEQTNNNEILERINKQIDFNNSNIYKEYEFIYEKDNIKYHGIIDLLIEKEQEIIIIDYKLKNILDNNYIKQLEGYKDYIKTKTNKTIKIYLYSILDNELSEIIS